MKRHLLSLFLLPIFLLYGGSCLLALEVDEITGGDLYLLDTGEEVRLAGVDTSILKNPEKKGRGFTEEGLRYLSNLFAKAEVRVEDAEVSPDSKGRRIVYLYVIEKIKKIASEPSPFAELVMKETLVNREIILRGYAKRDRQYRGRYERIFEQAEKEAKLNSQGWWRR